MSHLDLQRALRRVCLAPLPDEADLALLGAPASRWVLYRTMVRSRFRDTIASGLPRTRNAIGPVAFGRTFDAFLATEPPRTRLIREASLEFADFAARAWNSSLADDVPAWAPDLARFEAAQLATAFAPPDASRVDEFAMDRPVAMTHAHRFVRAAWDVHEPTTPEGHTRGSYALLTYRDRESLRVETRVLSQTAGELFAALEEGATPTEALVAVVAQHGGAADAAFLESVADLVTDLIERGIVLGAMAR